MATVFLPAGRSLWSAKICVWNASSGRLEWRKVATGARDKGAAMGIATALEAASGEARAGGMSRQRAESLVALILRLAGVPFASAPSLAEFGDAFFSGRSGNVGKSTARKYAAHWSRLKAWAGERAALPVDRWSADLCAEYYRDCQREFSATTANDHLRTLAMLFTRAEAAGHIQGNPASLVESAGNDSVGKHVLTRGEVAALLRAMRIKSDLVGGLNLAWSCLVLLGWHTGHRLQDLLSLTGASVERRGVLWCVVFKPAKKASRGGRGVVLPVPRYLGRMLQRLGSFSVLHNADNRNGLISGEFVAWLRRAGIDPLPVKRGKRTINLKSFHSFRHGMASRLAAAGVPGDLARLVTDHASAKVHGAYVHAEVSALAGALWKARRL